MFSYYSWFITVMLIIVLTIMGYCIMLFPSPV
jgi:hypothetical protein